MNTTRVELLRLLGELSEKTPDLRLGQLVANVATLAPGANASAVWNADDQTLLAAIRRLLEGFRLAQEDMP